MGEARSEIVKVRVTPAEKRLVEAAARAAGAKVSEFARGRLLGEASGAPVEVREAVVDRVVPASRRATGPSKSKGPRSVVREGAPMTEVPKIAKRWWADE